MSDLRKSVLEILRDKDDYVNGEKIASKLDVSRVSVSKSVSSLKDRGYIIESKPGVVYKLKEIELNEVDSFIDHDVHYFSEVPSTQSVAQDLAEREVEEAIVLAEVQKKGRGRRDRAWESSEGGLWFTMILRPEEHPSEVSFLNIVAGVAVAKAIEEFIDIDPSLKWPNDILVNNKKVCGILSEMKGELDRVDYVLLGVGLNSNNRVNVDGSISLSEIESKKINRALILKLILNYFDELRNKDNSEIVKEWVKRSSTIGRKVKVEMPDETFDGEAIDLDENGALVVKKKDGKKEKVLSGDVVHLR